MKFFSFFLSGPRPHGYNKIDNSTSVIELDEIKVPMLPIGAPPEWVSTVQQVSLLMNKIKQKSIKILFFQNNFY